MVTSRGRMVRVYEIDMYTAIFKMNDQHGPAV